jgi:hypothetical protein
MVVMGEAERGVPSLVVLAPPVLTQVVRLLEVLGALDAVVHAQSRLVFVGDQRFELRQRLGVTQVAMDLVQVAGHVGQRGSAGGIERVGISYRVRRLVLERRMEPMVMVRWCGVTVSRVGVAECLFHAVCM